MNIGGLTSKIKLDIEEIYQQHRLSLDKDLSDLFPLPVDELLLTSHLRCVFQTTDQMKDEFVKFLKTIFYQLDEKKVLALMEELLADPDKTDEKVYEELLQKIHTTKKSFPFLSKLRSLFVLKSGMGKQAAELLKPFKKEKFHDYMEIYDRRYVKTIRKAAGVALDGKVIAVCDTPKVGLADRIQAGSLFSSYPYQQHVALNDEDCEDPFLYPEKTHQPISDEVEDNSIDMIACLGGLHHIPSDRVDDFVDSMHSKLRPGGVILVRDHNVKDNAGSAHLNQEELKAIASVVHTFVNAADGVSGEIEKKEIREFKSLDEWTELMEKHGFKRISKQELVLEDDPTENAMWAFVKAPTNLDELREAIDYRNDCTRRKEGTRATWIEWGNVRFSKQYAEYIQNHHDYAFDYIGHMRQHWQHFYHFLKESIQDKDVRLRDLIFSDNMMMNLFILTVTTIQCSLSTMTNLPSMLFARWKHGENWRNVCNLTELETFQAEYEKDYSDFLDHTPFYMYDYIGKMKEMWRVIWNSSESFGTKLTSALSATTASLGFIAKAALCFPIRSFYTAEANQEPETIKILIADPDNELTDVIEKWEAEKDSELNKNHNIEVIYETPDGYKLVSLPRYRPFTKICGFLSETSKLEVLEIGSQKEISIDLLLDKEDELPIVPGTRIVYEMERLQDEEERRYVTYQVNLSALKQFQISSGLEKIEYIHE